MILEITATKNKNVIKTIPVKDKLVNIVVKNKEN